MERYRIFTGEQLSEEKYLATWQLDNQTFEVKDKITKKKALEWFKFSNRSAIILWDMKLDKLVGYITPFLVKHDFASKYIISNETYHEALNEQVFAKTEEGVNADIYLFGTVLTKEYRDKKMTDKNSQFYGKHAFKILNEALVEWIYEIKKAGVSINYVLAEKGNQAGEKYLKSLGMKPCFLMKDDHKYARLFSPLMFAKCDNYSKLYELYQDEYVRKPYDKSILDNHEYLSIKKMSFILKK